MVRVVMTKCEKILEIVETSGRHMTVEQIFSRRQKAYSTVVLATVYNNLNRLWEEGKARKVSVEGMPDRYDRTQSHNH